MDAICIILKKNTEFADKMQIQKKKKKSQGWIDNWANGLLKCRSDQTKTLRYLYSQGLLNLMLQA